MRLPEPWNKLATRLCKRLLNYVVTESDSGFVWTAELQQDAEHEKLSIVVAPRHLEQVGGPHDGSKAFDPLTYDLYALWSVLKDPEPNYPRNMHFAAGGTEYDFDQPYVYLEGGYRGHLVEFYLLSCPMSDEADVKLRHGKEWEDLMAPDVDDELDEEQG